MVGSNDFSESIRQLREAFGPWTEAEVRAAESKNMSSEELLEQEENWVDAVGDVHVITEMDDDHLVHLRGWLIRNAPSLIASRLASAYSFASHLNGEMAQDAMDAEISVLEEANPHAWMEERPLFQAIDLEIDKRRGAYVCRVIERN